ncbi:unnamed protein product [Mycena citricolor]|uniref:Uncharacterized protein n=1 Tax=Mycena citricolor TaxID=2018698 RepID=A0AAD2HZ04_9AGAR|nr:unnamed protein product [Mycena citricolor]
MSLASQHSSTQHNFPSLFPPMMNSVASSSRIQSAPDLSTRDSSSLIRLPPGQTQTRNYTRSAAVRTPARVVGRGGQGSKLRQVILTPPSGSTPCIVIPVLLRTTEVVAAAADGPARIVGRGGRGSRPRELANSDARLGSAPRILGGNVSTPNIPRRTPAPIVPHPPNTPMMYRPGGRGGAGSRPRAIKTKDPAAAASKKHRAFRWPISSMSASASASAKGKSKAPSAADSLGLGLQRFDTIDTLGSAIEFTSGSHLAGDRRIYQNTVAQDGSASTLAGLGVQPAAGRLLPSQILRSLGGSGGALGGAGVIPRAIRTRRRASVSTFGSSDLGSFAAPSEDTDSLGLAYNDEYDDDDDFDGEAEDDRASEVLTYATTSEDQSEVQSIASSSLHPLEFAHPAEHDKNLSSWDRSTAMSRRFGTTPSLPPLEESEPFVHYDASDIPKPEIVHHEEWTGEWNRSDMQEVIGALRALKL